MTLDDAIEQLEGVDFGNFGYVSAKGKDKLGDVGDILVAMREAKAIIDKLPKTADGVPVTSGTVVWVNNNDGVTTAPHRFLGTFGDHPVYNKYALPDTSISISKDCYSTEKAALAAKG